MKKITDRINLHKMASVFNGRHFEDNGVTTIVFNELENMKDFMSFMNNSKDCTVAYRTVLTFDQQNTVQGFALAYFEKYTKMGKINFPGEDNLTRETISTNKYKGYCRALAWIKANRTRETISTNKYKGYCRVLAWIKANDLQ